MVPNQHASVVNFHIRLGIMEVEYLPKNTGSQWISFQKQVPFIKIIDCLPTFAGFSHAPTDKPQRISSYFTWKGHKTIVGNPFTIMPDPCMAYLSTVLIYHQNQLNVPKSTSPMDPMGIYGDLTTMRFVTHFRQPKCIRLTDNVTPRQNSCVHVVVEFPVGPYVSCNFTEVSQSALRKKNLYHFWLVVEPTHLKNYESKMGSSSSTVGVKIQNL